MAGFGGLGVAVVPGFGGFVVAGFGGFVVAGFGGFVVPGFGGLGVAVVPEFECGGGLGVVWCGPLVVV